MIGRGGFGVVKMVRAKKTGVRSRSELTSVCLAQSDGRAVVHDRYALKCVRKRDVVEKNVQDALVSELSILKEAWSREEQHRAGRVLLSAFL